MGERLGDGSALERVEEAEALRRAGGGRSGQESGEEAAALWRGGRENGEEEAALRRAGRRQQRSGERGGGGSALERGRMQQRSGERGGGGSG